MATYISKPANNAREAVQWLYFGYLGAIKTQNGAAMSVGVSLPSWIYIFKETLKKAHSQRQRHKSLSTIW